ncbi:hypothetical protein ACSVDA_21910 [Cytobacillus sp. Hm23]
MIVCNPTTNHFVSLHSSLHAPIEPTNPNCAETVAQLLSIGYKIEASVALSTHLVQYILVL